MHKEQRDNTLFFVTAGIIFAEVFLFLDRITGGGLSTVLAAVAVVVVFMVLVNLVFPKLKNEKLKLAMTFVFAGMEFLSVYIMWGILGNIFFGIIPAGIVFAGTIEMLHKIEEKKQKAERFARKKNVVTPETNFVPEATEEEIEAEEEATAVAI